LIAESERIGNKRYKLKYPELKEWGITGKKVKSHFYRSQKLWPGNTDKMAAEFENFITFYQELSENGILKSTVKVVENWFQKKTKNNAI
jgi:hypothetical protein